MSSHYDQVTRYFHACSHESAEAIAACFCPEAVVYDNNHRPVRGAQAIGAFYVTVRDRWQGASWHVDTFLDGPAAAASEWTMRAQVNGTTAMVRGSEHYEFEGDLIRQIRQYWRFDPDTVATGLIDYPYDADSRFTRE
ncbi:nuclear transport factor 2 family protein [Salinisphaera sp. T31B1]|uniref:nuclear transport factor 2 family protein n=1 Tax=Salinisphaera sp. T31B1 TaxID=727963 RepID=UPI00333E7EAB